MKDRYGLLWLLIILLFGCAGIQKTSEEPLHAETGAGVTIWKIPILGIGGWGFDGRTPEIIIHKYDYTAKPPPSPPDTPPAPPTAPPAAEDHKKIDGSRWDDPSLIIFKNESPYRVGLEIDGQKIMALEPYQATPDIHLSIGKHRVKLIIEKPTRTHGIWEVVKYFSFQIRPDGRMHIFRIYH